MAANEKSSKICPRMKESNRRSAGSEKASAPADGGPVRRGLDGLAVRAGRRAGSTGWEGGNPRGKIGPSRAAARSIGRIFRVSSGQPFAARSSVARQGRQGRTQERRPCRPDRPDPGSPGPFRKVLNVNGYFREWTL